MPGFMAKEAALPVPDPAFDRIVQSSAPGSRLLRLSPLEGGTSNQMTVLACARPGAQVERMILRRPGGGDPLLRAQAVEKEFGFLQLARAAGLPVPEPLYLDMSGEILPSPYLVEGYIAGALAGLKAL